MKFSDLHPNIKIRICTDFFTDLTQKTILPFMAIYLSTQIGAGWAGVFLTVNILASMFAGLGAGYWSDRIGRKKLMVLAQSLQVFALICLAAANSPWMNSIPLTCFMFLLSSISSGITVPIASAMIIDVSSDKERQYVYGLQYWTTNVAITFGALLGGLLFEPFRFLLFSLVCVESIATLLILIFFIHETMDSQQHLSTDLPKETRRTALANTSKKARKSNLKNVIDTYKTILQDHRFMVFFTATVLAISLELQLDKYIAVRLKNEFTAELLGFQVSGVHMFSAILMINTVLVALIAIPFAKWMSHLQSRTIITVGLLLYTAGFATLAFSNWAWLLIASAGILTVGELMYAPVRQVILAGIIPDSNRAAYMAADGLSYHLAALLGSLGLTVGTFLPSYMMAGLYVTMGLAALYFFRISLRAEDGRQQNFSYVDAS
ncbi:Na(+), Li(+), K(+)/H(+) antiporter [Paenibacillus sp. JJ-100]|uniref:MFS transporter n=1 Tax=Paenibacillus sp. JJ-100 TaxID=2974896 RepID=UPI0022FF6008|nr:MFS transporter [Paenibacillus sp. JJ-100]CAI6082291.1 Na(+), Li(+), K(+)/H(+) antiporter [Paenibacillus sp. JJ-100]